MGRLFSICQEVEEKPTSPTADDKRNESSRVNMTESTPGDPFIESPGKILDS